ncbi:class I SAM-dependent methyltransferase [Filimonas effusa]|uniref:Methyltransferase domain-containing protein n=1 Tax=Filimonas effusa TaxID=2508721 RepID=A0A4Q1D498_9BACT|nr:methyltransferase domain-containing protein [Filimonas effusa]RXK83282.1 methyltransferase domain-containing protein [Filimonas effusa]
MQQVTLNYQHTNVHLWLPDAEQVKAAYYESKSRDAGIAFPHWSKLWPSALAMASFLDKHAHYIQDKQVVELAAGLGLPSLVAAAYAKQVHSSDYLPEAVDVIKQSVQLNHLTNMTCEVLDWNHLPAALRADVVLLSDINYEPEAFEQLYKVIAAFIHSGAIILLSTPQRLMARPFIERLLPWCTYQEEAIIETAEGQTFISTLVLQSG